MATKVKLSKTAKARMEREAKKKCKQLAKEVEERLEEKYEDVIDRFYSEYDPYVYVRHEERGMQRGMEKTYKPVFEKKDYKYRGGIVISEKDMYEGKDPKNGYRGTQSQVLWSFLLGYHGLPHGNIVERHYEFNGNGFDTSTRFKKGISTSDEKFQKDHWMQDTQVVFGNVKPLKEMREYFENLVEEMRNRVSEE